MAKLEVANEIQHQIDDQIRMREGAMKLMSACSTLNQALETSKNLLTINARILGLMSALQKKKKQHVLKEYNRQRSSVCMDSTDDCCPGRIAMSDIRVPLMWKDNVHFSGKTGDQSYYAFALIRCGDQVRDTSLYEITSADTDMYFAETLIFEDLLPDLKMEFEVYYTVITSSEAHPILKAPRASITIRSSSRRQAHFSAPKFCLAGHVQLCVDDIRAGMISKDLIMGGKGASGVAVLGDITEFPIHPLELWGQFCCELTAQPQCMVQKSVCGYCQIKVGDSWCKCYAEVYQCHIRGWKEKFQADKSSPDHFIKLEEEMNVCSDDTGGGSCILNITSSNEVLYTLQFLNNTEFMNWKFALRKELHNLRSWKIACHELMHIEELKKSRLSIPSTASFYDQIDIGDEPYVYQKGSSNGTHTDPSLSDIKEMHEVSELGEVFSDRSITVSEADSTNHLDLEEHNVQPSNEIQSKGDLAPSSVSSENGSSTISQNQETYEVEVKATLPTPQDVSKETVVTSGDNILPPCEVSAEKNEKESVDKNDIQMSDVNRKDSDTNISEELPHDEKETVAEMDISSTVGSSDVVIQSHNFPVESNLDEISTDENKADVSPMLNCDQPNTSHEVPSSMDSTVSETDTSCALSDASLELNSTVDTTVNEPDTDSCVQSDTSYDVIPSVNTSINEPETDSRIESDTSFDVVSSTVSETDEPATDPCGRITPVAMETDEYEKNNTNLDNDRESKSAPYPDKMNESEEKLNPKLEKEHKEEGSLELVKEGDAQVEQHSENLHREIELEEDLTMSENDSNEVSSTSINQSLACDDECAENNENNEKEIIVVENGSPCLKPFTDQVGEDGATLVDEQNGTDQDTEIMMETDSGENVALPIEDLGSTDLDRSNSVSCDVQIDDKQHLPTDNIELSVETTEQPNQNISTDELAKSVTSVVEKVKDEVNFDNSIAIDSCITDLDSKHEENIDKEDMEECHSETVQTSDVNQRTSSADNCCNDS